MRPLGLIVFLAPALASASTLGFVEAKRLADENESNLNPQLTSQLLEAQGNALKDALASCAQPDMDLSAFTLVFRLNSDGSIAESWREGDTQLALCTHKRLVSTGFRGKWQEPFYTSIEMSFH
ncbi:hypothetical protein GCM10011521_14830 [Arenimonas soli]|uniref:Uncharacterized protein n=1 Tax=Arenimonas soli TaxID=2269504 RepID=A0ABQ1HII5_9GAMM|nr:hypothetical protein [Arenimonas soli]GGA77553.1 hypothetical protein GCM10011521_14830 [Arenimonas soli]